MNEEMQEVLARHYGLGKVLHCAPLDGTRNRNYVLRAASGEWFVRKRYAGYCAQEWLDFDCAAMQFLHKRGVPVIPPRPASDGHLWWNDGESVWQVFPFIEGDTLTEGDTAQVRELGQSMARFHGASETYALRFDKLGPRGETCPSELLRLVDRIEVESPDCAAPLKKYREWVAEAVAAFSDERYAALPHSLVHGDIQPANVLIAETGLPRLVDMDWCAWRPQIYDLGFAVLFCCAERETAIRGEDIWSLTQACRLRKELVDAFFDAYADAYRPLSAEERAMLRPQMILSWSSSRVAGALKVPPEVRRDFLGRPPFTLPELGI